MITSFPSSSSHHI